MSLDVLEHIPEEELDAVLSEMAGMAKHVLHVIDTKLAQAILSDGRNAHVSLHDQAWWLERVGRYFPSARPIPIARPSRIGLKTWDDSLPAWRGAYVERRELVYKWLGKKINIVRKRKERKRRREIKAKLGPSASAS